MMEFEAKIPKKIGLPYCTFWQEFVSARMPRNVRPAVNKDIISSFNEIPSSQTKIDEYTHFAKINFFTRGSISPSILGLEIAAIPN